MTRNTEYGPKGWTPEQLASQTGKTYVITGANTGAGFEATRILLSKGASIIMMNRNEQKSQSAISALKQELGNQTDVRFVKMDLGSLASVRSAAKEILDSVPKIDALICNAAIAQVATQEMTVDGFESQLGVNHYGHFLLCGILFERIEASLGRIVVVASEGYKMGLQAIQFDDMNWDQNYHPNRTYCHSKLAQMMFAYHLQKKIMGANRSVQVYVCHPGASKTSLINEKASRMSRILFSIMATLPIVQSAEKGAYPEVMCATEQNLKQRAYYGPTGTMNWIGPVGECDMEPFVWDSVASARLWELSEQQTDYQWTF